MKQKIALCLFGGFASSKPETKIKKIYNPFESFKSFNSNIILEYNPDIFLHTWNTKFNDKLIKLYKPKKYKIENQIKFNVNIKDYNLNFLEFYNNIEDLLNRNINVKDEYNNLIFRTHSRWYSQSVSLRLMNSFSKINKIKYDFVIQARFDLFLNKKLDLSKLNINMLHLVNAQHLQKQNQLYDIFFVSNQKTSLLFSDIFKNLKKYPIDSTHLLPIFLEKNRIKYNNSFKFKDIILKRYYDQYIDLNTFSYLKLKAKGIIIKFLKILIKSLKKLSNFLST